MERAFLSDDVEKLTEQSRKLRTFNQSQWMAAREFLTFFDTIRFCSYLALPVLDARTKSKSKIKNKRLLASLRRDRFGKVCCCRMVSTLGCHPGIYAKKKSSPNLSHCGHSFYITVPVLLNNALLQKRLAGVAHLYCDSTMDSRDFTMHKACFRAINSLRKNNDIIITKPDKGSGVVLSNKSDYVDKPNKILDD